jgi:hypothetical protein
VWNERGAVCVNDWRRRQYVADNPKVHDEDAVTATQQRCEKVGHALPSCQSLLSAFPTGWQTLGRILTAFPTENLTER